MKSKVGMNTGIPSRVPEEDLHSIPSVMKYHEEETLKEGEESILSEDEPQAETQVDACLQRTTEVLAQLFIMPVHAIIRMNSLAIT